MSIKEKNRIDELAKRLAVLQAEIAERRHGEELLRQKNAELENMNLARNRFLANMSHELRTPITSIIGFSEFMIDEKLGPLNDKQKEYLTDLLNSGMQLLQLINDVLDLSKIEAGKMELAPEIFSLRRAVDEVCSIISPLARKKGVEIKQQFTPGVQEVHLDQQKFKQVVYNLLSNAVKFTPDGGQVEIAVNPEAPDRFQVRVIDNGIGIKPEDMDRLFAEFQQLGSNPVRRSKGTGLGLMLTKRIVELQQGEIRVESEYGKGSTFTVSLPIANYEERSV